MTIVRKINKLYRYWERLLVYAGCVMIALISLCVTVDIVLRNVFNTGILGMTEYTSLWLVFVFLAALCMNTSENRQIVVEFVTEKAPPATKEALNLFARFVALFLFVITMQVCFDQAVNAFTRGLTLTGVLPLQVWPYRMFMAVVWGSVIIRFVIDIIFSIDAIRHKKVYRYKPEPAKPKKVASPKITDKSGEGSDDK